MKQLQHYLWILLLTFTFAISAQDQAPDVQAEEQEIRVLFVGNSYTYYWNMPLAVTLMAESLGKKIFTKQSTIGGSNLEEHWKQEKETQTRALIEQGEWDYVVFNNHSLSPRDLPESFDEYSLKFAELVKQKGAKPVFYMTWARKHNRLMQTRISEAYRNVTKAAGAEVVPVGEIWMQSISLHPEKDLYAIDGSHPSPLGSYLTALAFTRYFTGMSVQEVPNKLYIKDNNGDKLYISMLQDENGDFFRDLVDTWNVNGY